MIVALDLDDTLYPELSYVHSGFRAVARELARRWGVDPQEALTVMDDSLNSHDRGGQFDEVVRHFSLEGRQSVKGLVDVYRHHDPEITLPEETRTALDRLRPRPLYLVTDGHKVVQQRKVEALGIAPRFEHVYLTHRYGIAHRKPSTRVFELMMRRERCAPSDIVYVGDDASKDFRGIRPLGVHTVRILTGRHATARVPPDQDAEQNVAGMAEVPDVVARLEAR